MMSTINDVSRLAGVSKATVSRVLSGSRGVKEASRQAVLQAAEALNYRPNMIAQSLLSQSTGCIGVICAQDNINQTTSYLYALEKQLSQHQKHQVAIKRQKVFFQRVVPQLQAFNRAVPQNVMVFSLAGSLQLPGIPTIPAIEYSMDAMASRIVNWLTEKTDNPGGSPLRGDLIIPKH